MRPGHRSSRRHSPPSGYHEEDEGRGQLGPMATLIRPVQSASSQRKVMHQRPVLEVVGETQAHTPERAGVGQQLP